MWRAPTDPTADAVARLERTLDADERERARRMRTPALRAAAVAAAGLLRALLAPYAGRAPETLRFVRGAHGKPSLDGAGPSFNLSHSGGLLLLAVRAAGEVGVDLEEVVPARADDLLVERVLTPGELALWRASPEEERARLFFRVWTHKEAWMKGTGLGLATDPRSLEVLLPGGEGGARLAAQVGEPGHAWSLVELDPGPGHAACLAVAGGPATVRTWDHPRRAV